MATATTHPTPVLPPPPGETSDFDHPESLARVNFIAIGVAVPLITIFFGLRVYTRIWLKRTWIFEDWLALIAFIGTVTFCGTGSGTMAHNGGKHEWDITSNQLKEASYWFNAVSINYGVTILFAKLAVLWLYRRVFSPLRWSPFDISIVFLIVVLTLFYTSTTIVKIWECTPRAKIWDPLIPGTCVDIPMLLNVSGLFNTVTDFIILILPIQAVWNMHMTFKNKVYIVLVFTFGLCAPAFSLAGSLVRLKGSSNPDKNWVQPDIIMWGLAELTTGVLCFSFPELGLIFKRKRKHHGPTTSIVNGKYLERKAGGSNAFSTVITHQSVGTYIELEEGNAFGAPEAAVQGNQDQQRRGRVTITQEFRVDESCVV